MQGSQLKGVGEYKPAYVYANEKKRIPKNMIDEPKSALLEMKSKLMISNLERKKEAHALR